MKPRFTNLAELSENDLGDFFLNKGYLMINRKFLAYSCGFINEKELDAFFKEHPDCLISYNYGYACRGATLCELLLEAAINNPNGRLMQFLAQSVLFNNSNNAETHQASYDDLITLINREELENEKS